MTFPFLCSKLIHSFIQPMSPLSSIVLDAEDTALNKTNSLTSNCLHSSERRQTKISYIVCQMVRNATDKNKE